MSSARSKRKASAYRPKVEALEAIRLLDAGVFPSLSGPPFDQAGPQLFAAASQLQESEGTQAWDAVLDQNRVADLLAADSAESVPDPATIHSGLNQLGRYLGRAWARAGIPPQHFEDCTQTVYLTLIENLGRDGFDHLAGYVGRLGVREVLSRVTSEGPDFFRAIDMVKKRASRVRSHLPLDEHRDQLASPDDGPAAWKPFLNEMIDRTLTPREADLIRDTMLGKSPAEIAQERGLAPKTVSNEKTKALSKLREAVLAAMRD